MGVCGGRKEKKNNPPEVNLEEKSKQIEQRLKDLEIDIEAIYNERESLIERGLTQQAEVQQFKLDRLYKEQNEQKQHLEFMQSNIKRTDNAATLKEKAQHGYLASVKVITDKQQELDARKKRQENEEKIAEMDNELEEYQGEQDQIDNRQKEVQDVNLEEHKRRNEQRLKQKRQQQLQQQSIIQSTQIENIKYPSLVYPNLERIQFVSLPNSQVVSYRSAIAAY